MKIGHLSVSQMNTYLRCPMQYFIRYCEGIKSPPGAALTLGSAFHAGVGYNYKQKVETHQDLPVGDILDVFSTDFDERAHTTAWFEDEKPGEIKDGGIETLREYHQIIPPITQPAIVEQKFEMSFKNKPWLFVGYVDLVTDSEVIVETKTTSRKPSEPQHDHRMQTVAYAIGHRTNTKEKEKGVRIDYAVTTKKPQIVSYDLAFEETHIRFFLNLLSRVADAIEKEIWYPNRGHFLCSDRWCGFWNVCHQKLGG